MREVSAFDFFAGFHRSGDALFFLLRGFVGPLPGYFSRGIEELHGGGSVGGYSEEDAGVSLGVAESEL